jgi:hypothetical protein
VDASRPVDDEREHGQVDRLLTEIIGAEPDCAQRVLASLPPGDHDDLGRRREAQQLGDGRKALFHPVRIGGQTEVLQHQRRLEPPRRGDRLLARAGTLDLEPIERPLQLPLQSRIVLDDQQSSFEVGTHAAGFLLVPRASGRAAGAG